MWTPTVFGEMPNDRRRPSTFPWLTGEATVFVESENESRDVSHGKLRNTQRGTPEVASLANPPGNAQKGG